MDRMLRFRHRAFRALAHLCGPMPGAAQTRRPGARKLASFHNKTDKEVT
jgi:hypothetical protein